MTETIERRNWVAHAVIATLIAVLAALPSWSAGGSFSTYSERTESLLSVPGATNDGLYGFGNPAVLSHLNSFESIVVVSNAKTGESPDRELGVFMAFPGVGFGVVRRQDGRLEHNQYRIAVSGGDRTSSFGFAFGWSQSPQSVRQPRVFSIGSLLRPFPHLSVGLAWTSTLRANAHESAIDVSLRPFGTPRITLFSDAAIASGVRGDDEFWSVGAEFELRQGLSLSARYRDDDIFTIGLALGIGSSTIASQVQMDNYPDRTRRLYALRIGRPSGNGLDFPASRKPQYLHLKLNGAVKYRRYALFDRSHTLVSLLSLIESARTNDKIRGVAINLSGVRVDYEKLWELRQQLQSLRDTGKRVVVYIDNVGLRHYHFASVADHIILDPSGLLTLEGFVAGSTYLKGALERLGVGVEEIRFKEFKSALEPIVRKSMSDDDRQQWQEFIDDVYGSARADIARARGIDHTEFDRLVDEVTLFLPEEALHYGLVDTLARWHAVESILEGLEGRPTAKIGPRSLRPAPNRVWGEPPRIAVVYALGVCAMNDGMAARRLVIDLERVREDTRVKSVVLRVDSPGGEILASDLVADALRRVKEKKPVIVSQGAVAASGGYWVSMYATHIVASPLTLTGSIGVIYGWFYNRGLKEKLRLSTDFVSVGAHADLPFGMPIPLFGSLPDRNLKEDERAFVSRMMLTTYERFVKEVASARGHTIAATEAIAKGRIWTGRQAVDKGLVDELGGLMWALRLAKIEAGLPTDRPATIDEYPRTELIDWGQLRFRLMGQIPATTLSSDKRYHRFGELLRFRLEHSGKPLLLGGEEVADWYLHSD